MSEFYTYYDRSYGQIRVKGRKDGKPFVRHVPDFSPYLFVDTDKETDWKNVNGGNVAKVQFKSFKEATNYLKQFNGIDGFKIYGTKNYQHAYVVDQYRDIEYDGAKIKVFTLDIEVKADSFPKPEEAKYPIDCITIHDSIKNEYYCFSLYPFDTSDERLSGITVQHKQFSSEVDLLNGFVMMIAHMAPDIITGWNTEGFDIPYLCVRINKLLGESRLEMLSPFKDVKAKEVIDDFKNVRTSYDIVGIPNLDYLLLYKKHTFVTRESYRLDFIGEIEGVGRKTVYDADSLYELANTDTQTYQVYNIIDVNIVVELDRKLKLMDVTYALSYMAMSNYVDTLGTTAQWAKLVYTWLYKKNIVPNVYKEDGDFRDFVGGFVKDPKTGKYGWTVSFDYASLYPHLIMHQNLGPETFVARDVVMSVIKDMPEYAEYVKSGRFDMDVDAVSIQTCVDRKISEELLNMIKNLNLCMAPNGSFYQRNKKSFFNEIMGYAYSQRKVVKKEMLKYEQEEQDLLTEIKRRGLKV
jgi:DNA polymerase elongation subunit (family B)